MYKTTISQLTEDDANNYIICYNCKNLTHQMRRSVYGNSNHCSISGLGMSSSTVVGECVDCYDTRTRRT